MTILNRLKDAWAVLMGKAPADALAVAREVASIKRELAELRLDLIDARKAVSLQRSIIDQLQAGLEVGGDDHLERLLVDLAAPLSQLRMQACLMDSGTQISSASVMALARRLADLVEQAGLEPIAEFGQTIPFDPAICEPLAADSSFVPEEAVVVKFIGYKRKGRVIRKAMVERTN